MKVRQTIRTVLLAAGCLALIATGAAGGTIGKPAFPEEEGSLYFAGPRAVRLLADAASDEDPRVRCEAVRNLGQTGNRDALPAVRKALDDADVNVRCEAMRAAAELGGAEGGDIVIAALGKDEPRLRLEALRAVRALRLARAGEAVGALTTHSDASIRSAAIMTLTHIGMGADDTTLEKLLQDESSIVRLRAAENAAAAMWNASRTLQARITTLMESDPRPYVRGAALAVFARQASAEAVRAVVLPALENESVHIRDGAVHGLAAAARAGTLDAATLDDLLAGRIADDPSPLVRLSAVRVAGEFRCRGCVDEILSELVRADWDDWEGRAIQEHPYPYEGDVRAACHRSLVEIGSSGEAGKDVVGKATAALLERFVARLVPEGAAGRPGDALDKEQQRLQRNVIACCRVLGDVASDAAYELQLATAGADWLAVDSTIRIALSDSLGRIGAAIGDKRAVAPLLRGLKYHVSTGPGFMTTVLSMSPPPPFNEMVAAAEIRALGALGADEAFDDMVAFAACQVQTMRFSDGALAAIETFPRFVTPERRDRVRGLLKWIVSDANFAQPPRFAAMLLVGELKLDDEAMRKALGEVMGGELFLTPRGYHMVQAAGWALQEITGQTPGLPPMAEHADPRWLVRPIGE